MTQALGNKERMGFLFFVHARMSVFQIPLYWCWSWRGLAWHATRYSGFGAGGDDDETKYGV